MITQCSGTPQVATRSASQNYWIADTRPQADLYDSRGGIAKTYQAEGHSKRGNWLMSVSGKAALQASLEAAVSDLLSQMAAAKVRPLGKQADTCRLRH